MWPNPLETADFATFIEELLNGKLIKNLLSHQFFLHLNIYFDFFFFYNADIQNIDNEVKLNKKQILKQDSTFTKRQTLFMNAAENI